MHAKRSGLTEGARVAAVAYFLSGKPNARSTFTPLLPTRAAPLKPDMV